MANYRLFTHTILLMAIFSGASILGLSVTAFAIESTRCIELAKECFAYANEARESCFTAVSAHPFCRETRTGALAAKRSQFSSLTPPQDQDGPSFLGPHLVNYACVENFDNAWSVALIDGQSSAEDHLALEKTLSKCAHVPSSDILRP
jgi:hypothetical protein